MRKGAFAIAVVFFSQTASAGEGPIVAGSVMRTPVPVITPADAGKPIALIVGQCMDVRLSTQAASTGYEWYLAPGLNEAMSLAARKVTEPAEPMPGAPATLDYILCAAAPGEVVVKFIKYRVWEKKVPPVESLTITVKIGK